MPSLGLIIVASLLVVGSAQRTFYCNSTGAGSIADRDFYLVTRRHGEASYPRDLHCKFVVSVDGGNSSQLFVEILEANMTNAYLSIRTGGVNITEARYLLDSQYNLMSRTGSMQVEFQSSRYSSSYNSSGVRIRVRAVRKTECPPGWHRVNETCFGTGSVKRMLSFEGAQSACNSLQSNLLLLPSWFRGRIGDLLGQLPGHLTANYSWIGLTDIHQQGRHVWLDGSLLYSGATIGCAGSYCSSTDRCAAVIHPSNRTVYKDHCFSQLPFICHAPPGGASTFYRVPQSPDGGGGGSGSGGGSEWWLAPAVIIVGIAVFAWLFCCNKKKRIIAVIVADD